MHIKLDHIYKSFEEGKPVLSDLNFDDQVNNLAIIGPSGCGKSTLLRIIGGLLNVQQGSLFLDGEQVGTRENDLLNYRKNIGFVFQKDGLFHHMTAKENIMKPLMVVHGYERAEAENISEKLLKRFGLEEDGEKLPKELSGGQQQRIAIARAIAPSPKLLLLDEPTSALDPEYTTEVLDVISDLKNQTHFIIVTHEMGFARHACDKIAFMNQGKIGEYGTSEKLFTEPKSKELIQFLSKLLEWNM